MESNENEHELIKRIIAGDKNLFQNLVERHQHTIFKIVAGHVPAGHVEEVAHDTFIRIYNSLHTYGGQASFAAWASTLAVRQCYDFWRKRYRSREVPMSALAPDTENWLESVLAGQEDTGEESEHSAARRELVQGLLAEFSAEDRMLVTLFYGEERSVKECAAILGWSFANVKVRAFRLRKKLRKALELVMERGKVK